MLPLAHFAAANRGIVKLILSNFRSHRYLNLALESAPSVALIGPNGAGKTNVLEAISYLIPGRGLRGTPAREALSLIALAESTNHCEWSVFAELNDDNYDNFTVAAGLQVNSATATNNNDKKLFQVNGKALNKRSEVLEKLWLLSLTPDIDSLLRDSSQGRRRFLDNIVTGLYPDHADHLHHYDKAVRERLTLLKSPGISWDQSWIQEIENQMAMAAVAIAERRLHTVELLNHSCHTTITSFLRPHLACNGTVEELLRQHSAVTTETQYRNLLATARLQDQQTGTCHYGPHRSDLAVTHSAKHLPGHMASTGEQKSLILAITLAAAHLYQQHKTGVPLLLLDEVVAHLDTNTRTTLLEEIAALKIQTWMTSTELTPFQNRDLYIHQLGSGNKD